MHFLCVGGLLWTFVRGDPRCPPHACEHARYFPALRSSSARYERSTDIRFLTAENGVTGDYELTGDTTVSAFYRVEDRYDANAVYLDITQYRSFEEAARTVNQIEAATTSQTLRAQRDPVTNYPTNPFYRAIAYLPDDATARNAFDQISGELFASAQAGLLEESRFLRQATGAHARRHRRHGRGRAASSKRAALRSGRAQPRLAEHSLRFQHRISECREQGVDLLEIADRVEMDRARLQAFFRTLAQPLEMAFAGNLLHLPQPVLLRYQQPGGLGVLRDQQIEGEPRIGKHRRVEV